MAVFELPDVAYSGVIFDCDGTLSDTMPLQHRAWSQALSDEGGRFDFAWDIFMSRAGMSTQRTVEELNEQFGTSLDPTRVSELKERYYQGMLAEVRPVEEVVAFARKIHGTVPVAVASGSAYPDVVTTLKAIGVDDLFDIIITPEAVKNGKPDPEMFLLAASRMGVEPQSCLVFEDAELGLLAARRANMTPVVVKPESVRALERGLS